MHGYFMFDVKTCKLLCIEGVLAFSGYGELVSYVSFNLSYSQVFQRPSTT